MAIFTTDRPDISAAAALATERHNIHDYLAVQSDTERAFARRLEAAEEVVVYAKLPRGFTIPTPGDDYNPDWAIAFELSGERHIYFVAETKGSMLAEDLRTREKQKIESARAFFRDVAKEARFDQISDYAALMQAIS